MPTLRSLYSSFTERRPAGRLWTDAKAIVSSYKMTVEACMDFSNKEETSEQQHELALAC